MSEWRKEMKGVWCWGPMEGYPPVVELCQKGNPNAVNGPGYYAWKEEDGDLDATGPYKTLKEAKAAALGGGER